MTIEATATLVTSGVLIFNNLGLFQPKPQTPEGDGNGIIQRYSEAVAADYQADWSGLSTQDIQTREACLSGFLPPDQCGIEIANP